MKKAYKLTIAKQNIDGATIEHYLTENAAVSRLEWLTVRSYSVTLSRVVTYGNTALEVI